MRASWRAWAVGGLAGLSLRCGGDEATAQGPSTGGASSAGAQTVGTGGGAGGSSSSNSTGAAGAGGSRGTAGTGGGTPSDASAAGGAGGSSVEGGAAGQKVDAGPTVDAPKPNDAGGVFDSSFPWDASGPATITRIWLSHKSAMPTNLVVNWETTTAGDSTVMIQGPSGAPNVLHASESVTLHHVEVPLSGSGPHRYAVATGSAHSAEYVFKGYPTDVMRVAVVADWQSKPSLASIVRDDIHLLLTAGDNVAGLHDLCGDGVKDCAKPYSALIDAYADIFRSIPFMPVLGNHDKEIRSPSSATAAQPGYDVDATAFRMFFELPDEEWHWTFAVPDFEARFIALDIAHVSDLGTPLQACHPYASGTPQFNWYQGIVQGALPRFVVTLYNEQNQTVRNTSNGAWANMFAKTSMTITGYGYMGERAETGGVVYYTTALRGGDNYVDSARQAYFSVPTYILLTFNRAQHTMTAELKALQDGASLDRRAFP